MNYGIKFLMVKMLIKFLTLFEHLLKDFLCQFPINKN